MKITIIPLEHDRVRFLDSSGNVLSLINFLRELINHRITDIGMEADIQKVLSRSQSFESMEPSVDTLVDMKQTNIRYYIITQEGCSFDPTQPPYDTASLGMFHCPECGEMVVAGCPHPDYKEGPDEKKTYSFR